MAGIHLEVFFASAYALFLMAAAAILDRVARGTHRRTHSFQHRGFKFLEHLDEWLCPMGERLRRHRTDHALGVHLYRAKAEKCNACSLKKVCTDSPFGRELARPLDDWVDTEASRFHRILSLVLIAVSGLLVLIAWVRHHSLYESMLLSAVLGSNLLLGISYWGTLQAGWRKDAFLAPASRGGRPPSR